MGTLWRMSSAREIKERKWCYEGIKTFLFLRVMLRDTTQNTQFAYFIGTVLLTSKTRQHARFCTEQGHGVSKGKHPCSEITAFTSKGAASQAAWHPAPSHGHIPPPQTFLTPVAYKWSRAPHRLTYHPLYHFYSYG